MDANENDDAALVDLGPEEQWVNPEITNAVNALQEALYSAGCNVNNMKITIGGVPGEDATINGDYGIVTIVEVEL